jgi:hypothetical protein
VKERAMASREQKGKEVPAAGSSYKEQFGKPTKRK